MVFTPLVHVGDDGMFEEYRGHNELRYLQTTSF
jgi:hypothetical protein